jgi:glycosyltransferase involved in cell wall biosynthesis
MGNIKIAFLGSRNIFDYFKIGGFESFIRRLSIGLINSGSKVDYILYDSPTATSIEVLPNLIVNYFHNFEQASQILRVNSYNHVFRVWLSPADRLKYLFLKGPSIRKTRWHHLFLAWPDSLLKRAMNGFESWVNSRNGLLVCVSPRQYIVMSRYFKNACHIMPPVPEDYYLSPEDKELGSKIKVTFLGNLTKDKFIEEIIDVFKHMQGYPHLSFSIYGTHDPLNSYSTEVHNWLKSQKDILYIHIDMKKYSAEIDNLVERVLKDTDVFVQPYRTLNNTLDMPLLLLEAMAALCPIITTPIGSVQEIYGPSNFVIPRDQFSIKAKDLLENLTYEQILLERERIYVRTKELDFSITSIMGKLLPLLKV